jgi:hypothetical protein
LDGIGWIESRKNMEFEKNAVEEDAWLMLATW